MIGVNLVLNLLVFYAIYLHISWLLHFCNSTTIMSFKIIWMLTKFAFVIIEFANNQLQKKKFHLDATSIVILGGNLTKHLFVIMAKLPNL